MGKRVDLVSEVTSIIHDFVKNEVKNPPEDLIVAMKEISKLTLEAARQGYSRLIPELRDQVGVIMEIYRIRLNKHAHKAFFEILEAVIRIVSKILK